MNKRTIFWIVAIIVGAALIYYFMNNNPATDEIANQPVANETTNTDTSTQNQVPDDGYLTYTNNTFGFSMNYPSTWHWNATPEIRDIDCRAMGINGMRDDYLVGCDNVLGLVHFSNVAGVYCAWSGCLNSTFTESIDNPKKYTLNDNFMSAMIYKWPQKEYDDVLIREKNAKVKMATSDFIKVDGVDVHIYTWLGADGNCNSKTAYWSHNGYYFSLQFFTSTWDSCVKPEQELELFTHMVNSLKFF